ncbi:antiterminator LoaP [Paraeggerthella sp. Marseille-Q4926]|uniref:antiterminator LoaP n=1 Tax=Paraeggerthella sp. Marseille-Q4926 TaxID=2866587 RepID=UPI001CE47804|nr:antiterminator LoaP [Paraeggerthella sp. Marseille-Q4926]
MWYVAQVQAGRESSTLEMCKKLVRPSAMEDCFMPEYEVLWKIRGEWRLVKRLLFPGYLFFVTGDVNELHKDLLGVPMPIKLLGNEENSFFPLTDKERDWFLSFMDGAHVVRMSEGYIAGDKITVTRGPLMGFEGDIRKIDRHKRRAYIDVTLFGRTVPASVGLEIVRKSA